MSLMVTQPYIKHAKEPKVQFPQVGHVSYSKARSCVGGYMHQHINSTLISYSVFILFYPLQRHTEILYYTNFTEQLYSLKNMFPTNFALQMRVLVQDVYTGSWQHNC